MGFNQISNLNVHIVRMHRELRLVCCALCGVTFNKRKDLRHHELEEHYSTIKGKLIPAQGDSEQDAIEAVDDFAPAVMVADTEPEEDVIVDDSQLINTNDTEVAVNVRKTVKAGGADAGYDEHREASLNLVKLHGSPKKTYLKPHTSGPSSNSKRKSEVAPPVIINTKVISNNDDDIFPQTVDVDKSSTKDLSLTVHYKASSTCTSTVDTSAIGIVDNLSKKSNVNTVTLDDVCTSKDLSERKSGKESAEKTVAAKAGVTSLKVKKAPLPLSTTTPVSKKQAKTSHVQEKKKFLDRDREEPCEKPKQIVKHRIFKSKNKSAEDHIGDDNNSQHKNQFPSNGKHLGAKRKFTKAKQVTLQSSGSLNSIMGETQIRLCMGKGGKMIGYLKDKEGNDVLVNVSPVNAEEATSKVVEDVRAPAFSPPPSTPDSWQSPSPSPRKLRRSRIVTNHSSDSDSGRLTSTFHRQASKRDQCLDRPKCGCPKCRPHKERFGYGPW